MSLSLEDSQETSQVKELDHKIVWSTNLDPKVTSFKSMLLFGGETSYLIRCIINQIGYEKVYNIEDD